MNHVVFYLLVLAAGLLCAEERLPFDDRGTTYNPLTYVRTIEIADGAFVIEFRNEEESYFTVFVVTSEGVVAFDPLSDSAAADYAEVIRERAPGEPLVAIVYSHLHTDHIAGARVLRYHFGTTVPIIAHERVLRFFRERGTPYIDLPTETVDDKGKRYTFGNRTIELHYVGDAHTASMLVPLIPEIKMAYICDFANNDVVGWTDLPGIDIDEMLAMQRRVLAFDVEHVAYCHGQPGTLRAVERQIEYFETVLAAATKARDAGRSEDEAVETIRLPQYAHFANFDDWFEGNVRAMYRWAGSTRNAE